MYIGNVGGHAVVTLLVYMFECDVSFAIICECMYARIHGLSAFRSVPVVTYEILLLRFACLVAVFCSDCALNFGWICARL